MKRFALILIAFTIALSASAEGKDGIAVKSNESRYPVIGMWKQNYMVKNMARRCKRKCSNYFIHFEG